MKFGDSWKSGQDRRANLAECAHPRAQKRWKGDECEWILRMLLESSRRCARGRAHSNPEIVKPAAAYKLGATDSVWSLNELAVLTWRITKPSKANPPKMPKATVVGSGTT